MVMSSKKIRNMVGSDVDRALANIDAETPKPDMKGGDELKAAVAPKKAETFAEAFKAARARGAKTFSWDGKPGTTFTTKLATEGAKRSAPSRSSGPASAGAAQTKPNTPTAKQDEKIDMRFTGAGKKAPLRAGPPSASAERRKSVGKFFQGLTSLYTGSPQKAESKPKAAATASKPKEKVTDATWHNALRRVPGESVTDRVVRQNREMAGYKKGGKIDGCAVRGKTRAMRKK